MAFPPRYGRVTKAKNNDGASAWSNSLILFSRRLLPESNRKPLEMELYLGALSAGGQSEAVGAVVCVVLLAELPEASGGDLSIKSRRP
eukprot:5341645-Pyramimonas_sp.AAC.1